MLDCLVDTVLSRCGSAPDAARERLVAVLARGAEEVEEEEEEEARSQASSTRTRPRAPPRIPVFERHTHTHTHTHTHNTHTRGIVPARVSPAALRVVRARASRGGFADGDGDWSTGASRVGIDVRVRVGSTRARGVYAGTIRGSRRGRARARDGRVRGGRRRVRRARGPRTRRRGRIARRVAAKTVAGTRVDPNISSRFAPRWRRARISKTRARGRAWRRRRASSTPRSARAKTTRESSRARV